MAAATPAEQYLRYIYGADDIAIETACWPNDDLWMARGQKNPASLAEIERRKVSPGRNEVIWEAINGALCIIEMRDGKVDVRFLLDQIYFQHRELIVRLVHATLSQDRETLELVTTKAANVKFGGAKPVPAGDMDVYEEIIARLPVVRVSTPASDKVSRSVSYRVPLGANGLVLRLVKKGSTWLVDTDSPVEIPLEFFFR